MEFSTLPTSIDVTLHKYNYIDNQLWARIYNELDYVEADENSIIVHTTPLIELLNAYYQPMLRKIGAVGADFLHKEANTVYFLIMILHEMQNLTYIKFTRSYQKQYSRMIEVDGQKMLRFDFKILTITFRLAEFYTASELNLINPYLEKRGILDEGIPFISYKLSEFLDRIEEIVDSIDEDIAVGDLLSGILDLIEPKVESDNPTVLVVTDY
jgi:hypothetical protein